MYSHIKFSITNTLKCFCLFWSTDSGVSQAWGWCFEEKLPLFQGQQTWLLHLRQPWEWDVHGSLKSPENVIRTFYLIKDSSAVYILFKFFLYFYHSHCTTLSTVLNQCQHSHFLRSMLSCVSHSNLRMRNSQVLNLKAKYNFTKFVY